MSGLVAYRPRRVTRRNPQDLPYIRSVVAAIGQVEVSAGGWRRKDVLRGRANPLNGIFALFREMKEHRAKPADLEGANLALYNANRALITEGLPTIANETLAEALGKEQLAEGRENVSTIEVLAHPTPGNLRRLRVDIIAEMEASRHVVELIDAELLRMEAAR